MRLRSWVFVLFFLSLSYPVLAWGPQGHRLVALIARSQLDREVISTIDYYLKGMSWEDAATWMDDVQDEPKFEGMKSWHFVYLEKDKTYVQNKDPNVVNKLEYCFRMLQFRAYQTEETMNEIIKILFHLVADIHQPLHCGYPDDNGAVTVRQYLIQKETNLHKVWDIDIIRYKNMDIWHLAKVLVGMQLSDKKKTDLEKTDVQAWMKESRTLLPAVYNTGGKMIDMKYVDANAPIVEVQLIKAGLRLAAILNRYFR